MRANLSKALAMAAVCGAAVSAASAQSITTLFATNNNGSAGGGIYFQIVVGPSPITITALDENLGALAVGTAVPLRVFTAPTTYVGNEANAGAWTLATTGSGVAAGLNVPTPMTLNAPIVLAANTSYGIAVTHSDASGTPPSQSNYYTNGTGSNQTYSNSDLTINLGDATNVLFSGTPFSPRVWNGTIYYSLGGTLGACCRTNGTCVQTTSASCTAQSGTYRGDNTDCATANCPVGGACCLPNLTCTTLTSAACTAQSGTYRGDNTTCATANCPTPGACCLALGVCSQMTGAACTAAGGTYRGDSTSCATAACPGGFTMDCSLPGTFTDISATGASITSGDDATGPFTSSVTNALVTNPNLYACTNGFISDSATFATFTNATLPTASCTFGLFPNWDDLYVDPAQTPPGSLLHQGVVEGGVNVEIIQWNMVRTFAAGSAGPQGTFEVKIFGAGGPAMAQYLYQSMAWDGNGNSSTVGVQWASGAAYQASFNQAGSIPDNAVCSVVQTGAPAVCYANCDASTQQPCLNVLDFSCFLNQFAAGATYANCDGSTTQPVLNVLDFSCFLNRFAAGCSSC